MSPPVPVSPPDGSPSIHFIRNERVMLDSDLAAVYRIATSALNQAVDTFG